ncbi:MAG: NAD-dependent epimerase/dehydratase family protein, partial [Bryobacteraceae bacterium]
YNIEPVRRRVKLIRHDIGQASEFAAALAGADVIFNLAGEISHLHSMQFPERDLEINTVAQLRFISACMREAPGVRIVYAGTRQVYGVPQYLPVDEEHPIAPVDFNGVHKYAAMMYHLMLTRLGHLDAMVLRLTNVYGPRMALHIPSQGFLSAYLRRMLLGESLEVYGDGSQLRDALYVDDAVEAFLLAGACARPASRAYNVGGPEALSIGEIARIASEVAGCGPVVTRPFPSELKKIDIGSYYTDSSRIERELGWRPKVTFSGGIARSLEFYRKELRHYLPLRSAAAAAPERSRVPG